MSALRAFQVHDGEPCEGATLVFARTKREARSIGYVYVDVPFIDVEVDEIREPAPSAVALLVGEPRAVHDRASIRQFGFRCMEDPVCDCCDLAEMDGAFPLCGDCDLCEECGHRDDCPRRGGAPAADVAVPNG